MVIKALSNYAGSREILWAGAFFYGICPLWKSAINPYIRLLQKTVIFS